MQNQDINDSDEALERELLEYDDIFFLDVDQGDEISHAEVSESLHEKLVPVLNERSSFYRLTMALYRVVRLAKRQRSIETDADVLEIRAGVIADLRSSVLLQPSLSIMNIDTILAVAIAILIEVGAAC